MQSCIQTLNMIFHVELYYNKYFTFSVLVDFFSLSASTRYIFPFFPGSRDASDIIVIKKNIFINNILLTVRTFYDCMKNNLLIKNSL